MCIISLFPAGVPINEEGIRHGAKRNSDGTGWAVASKNGLFIGKSMNAKESIDALLEVREREGANSIVLVHSRFGTHGEYGEYNIHPFFVGDGEETVMAHNGILPSSWHPEKGDRRSDTRVFADSIGSFVNGRPNGVPSRSGGIELGKIIGSTNKLVFLSIKDGPKVRIVNAHIGVWDNGAWYSNSGYKVPSYSSYSSGSHSALYGGFYSGVRVSPYSGMKWDPVQNRYVPLDGCSIAADVQRNNTDAVDAWWAAREAEWRAEEAAEQETERIRRAARLQEIEWEEKRVAREIAEEYGGKCPNCHSTEDVDWISMLCEACDFCLDCMEGAASCGCFFAKTAAQQDAEEEDFWSVVDEVESHGGGWDDLPMAARDWLRENYPNIAKFYESSGIDNGVGRIPDIDEQILANDAVLQRDAQVIALPGPRS